MIPESQVSGCKRLFRAPALSAAWVAAALLVLLLLSYGNSFQASWHYDDSSNIVHNSKVHMGQWSWAQLRQSLSAGMAFQVISRPLAYMSFALNYRAGGLDVFGYHVVNLVIHWIAALFLFLFVRQTLKLPLLEGRYACQATMIAAIASSLWATHPIQVTAVTYIVQRMASMAGMFYIMAMYMYLRGRMAPSLKIRILFFSLSGLAAACGMLTKENTVMLGYAVLLYDFLLIQGISKKSFRWTLLLAAGTTLVVFMVGCLYMHPDFQDLAASFRIRPFSLGQRLLTQPRVIFFYLSLIAVPMSSRLSIIHDFETSLSFLTPWTTWASLGGLLLSIVLLMLLARRFPLLSFCGLFFFLNHAVEGSIINLEMVYEHRNYIPTMFIFVPITLAAFKGGGLFRYKPSFQRMIAGLVLIVIASQMHTTFAYNKVFQTELSLWSDVVVRYPEVSLGHLNLASVYWASGLFDRAFQEYNVSIELNRFSNRYQEGLAYYNLGLYESSIRDDYHQAGVFFRKARTIISDAGLWKKIAQTWMDLGNHKAALDVMAEAVNRWGDDRDFNKMMSISFLKEKQYSKALKEAQKVLEQIPGDPLAAMVMAQSYRFLSKQELSLQYLNRLLDKNPDNRMVLLSMAEIYTELGRLDLADAFLCCLIGLKGMSDISIGSFESQKTERMPYVPGKQILDRLQNLKNEPYRCKSRRAPESMRPEVKP